MRTCAPLLREPVALASIEYLRKAIRLRLHSTIAVLALVGVAASLDEDLRRVAWGLWPLLAGFAAAALLWWDEAYRLRRLLRQDGVAAVRVGNYVTVSAGKRSACLRTSASLFDRARRHALPRATL